MDENAAIQEAYSYEVYGHPTIKTGDGGDGDWFDGDETTASASAKGNPYMFTSRRWGHDINLQFNRARWYAPVPGRWLSRDPGGYVDGMNLYAYARSSAVIFVDPLGQDALVKNACCCCAEDIRIENIGPLPNTDEYVGYHGKSFDVVLDMSCRGWDRTYYGDCELDWQEWTNEPYVKRMKANEWNNMLHLNWHSPTFKPWHEKKPCAPTVTLQDHPRIPTHRKRQETRLGFLLTEPVTMSMVMYFSITLRSAPGCECALRSKSIYATLNLEVVGGRPTGPGQFVIGLPPDMMPPPEGR